MSTGLESHPQHELAKKQMKGFGGMVTAYIKGDIETSRTFLQSLKVSIQSQPVWWHGDSSHQGGHRDFQDFPSIS